MLALVQNEQICWRELTRESDYSGIARIAQREQAANAEQVDARLIELMSQTLDEQHPQKLHATITLPRLRCYTGAKAD